MPQESFILRAEHEEAFARAGLQRFEQKAARLLRERYYEQTVQIENTELREAANCWVSFARRFGLLTERQMFVVCEAGLNLKTLGIDICIDSYCCSILGSSAPPEERAEKLRTSIAMREKSINLEPRA